jgi:hypothetical protein
MVTEAQVRSAYNALEDAQQNYFDAAADLQESAKLKLERRQREYQEIYQKWQLQCTDSQAKP